ncbi:MAG: hypothetical protein A4E72_00222 [Syntrophus sp. PtaU1.Bin208]|nr:MAG: hypothetical protein A4E72_00222 [Syntrophus sp. PtaU1.Bin208]
MADKEKEKGKSLIKELPANISDFMTAFDLVTEGIDLALQSFLTTDDEKIFLRQLLNRLHGDRDQMILENYIVNQTSPDCFS